MNPFSERKILGHFDKLTKYLNNEEYPPILVEIDLTNKCTSDCPWCFGYLNRKWTDFMLFAPESKDTALRYNASNQGVRNLISDLANLGVKAITWTGGGDPTCHKNLTEFLKQAQELGIENGLITNGVISVKDALPYCTWIRFSVDAATKETYKIQHGRENHFELVVGNIKEIARTKQNCGYSTTIGVGFVTHKDTKNEIIDFAKLWSDSDAIDYIQYRPLLDKYGEKWFTDTQETIALIREAKSVDSRVTFSEPKYNAFIDQKSGQTKNCHGIFFETAIAADGLVYVCCHMKGKPQYAIGDLKKESIYLIWKRHLENRKFAVKKDCPAFCRHYGTNLFLEEEILSPKTHSNFI